MRLVDQVYQEVLPLVAPERAWLLRQTLLTTAERRAFVTALRVPEKARVLDVGTGFGPLAFDLVLMKGAAVVGVDTDAVVLAVARHVRDEVRRRVQDLPLPLEFVLADAYALGVQAEFDLVTARLLLQHLAEPARAVAAMAAAVRPGGSVCLVDIDDQFNVTEPEVDPLVGRLYAAYARAQRGAGGDRHVGRRLCHLLAAAGLTVTTSAILPQSRFAEVAADDPGLTFDLRQLEAARERVVAEGELTAAEFDEALRRLRAAYPRWEWKSTALVVAIGQRPADGAETRAGLAGEEEPRTL